MTLNEINAKIKEQAPHVTLYRGRGYLYYIYDDGAQGYDSLSIMVPYLYMQPSARWIREGVEFSAKTEGEIAERGQFGERFRALSAFAPMGNPVVEVRDGARELGFHIRSNPVEIGPDDYALFPHHRAIGIAHGLLKERP